jgi:hypothetical protein
MFVEFRVFNLSLRQPQKMTYSGSFGKPIQNSNFGVSFGHPYFFKQSVGLFLDGGRVTLKDF